MPGDGDLPHEPVEDAFPIEMQGMVTRVILLERSRREEPKPHITEADVISQLRKVPEELAAGNVGEVLIMHGRTTDGVVPDKFERLEDLDPQVYFGFVDYLRMPVDEIKTSPHIYEIEAPKSSSEDDWSAIFRHRKDDEGEVSDSDDAQVEDDKHSLSDSAVVRLTGIEHDGVELVFTLNEYNREDVWGVSSAVFLALKYESLEDGRGEYEVTASVIFHTELEPEPESES